MLKLRGEGSGRDSRAGPGLALARHSDEDSISKVSTMRKSILGFGLSGLAVVQAAALYLQSNPTRVVIRRGDVFPAAIRALDGSESLLEGRGCVSLFICTASCRHCARRAAARAQYEKDAALDVIWVIVGSRDVAARFASEYAFQPNELGFIDPSALGGISLRRRRFVVPGTPFRVVLDNRHVVASAVLAHDVPRVTELGGVCN